MKNYISELIVKIRKYLESKGVDINTRNYKGESNYEEIRNESIYGLPGGAMSLEEFVDRFMRTNCTFARIYDMGNPNEIEDSLCTDSAVASEICYILSLDVCGKTEANVLNELERKSGLIERIKNILGLI